jgi:hypothetical protein
VIVTGATVVPGVRSEVSLASEWYVPGTALLKMSNGIDTMPPGTGPPRTGRYSEPSAGADGMFLPLVPSRFSAFPTPSPSYGGSVSV